MLKGKGTITAFQKEVLISLANISDMSYFYLTGGTALAEFFFGHRRSYDLDFFTHEEGLIIPFSRIVESYLRSKYTLHIIRRFGSFLELEVQRESDIVRLHFAYDSPFRFEESEPSEFGIKVNDYKDLIVDKLLTFFGRWQPRDAIDLFFILKNESIDTLLEMAKEKDPGFDLYWFSVALQEVKDFPDEIDRWRVEMLVKIDVSELKDLFITLSRKIMDKIKGGQK